MSLTLPRARVEVDGRVRADEGVLDEQLESLLSNLGSTSAQGIPSHAFLPLDDNHWLVGKRAKDGASWRIMDPSAYGRSGHPAWLWTEQGTFAARANLAVPTPLALPLRQLLRNATPFSGSFHRTCQALAATVEAMRQRQGPVEVVVPLAAFKAGDRRGLWFMLAILTVLPPDWRSSIWVSTWEGEPKVEGWDLILTDRPHDGFMTVSALAPQPPTDLVASYILDRILSDDPESVEAAAYLRVEDAEDPWLAGLQAHLAKGVAGITELTPQKLREDPDGAVKALEWSLKSGTPVGESLARDLALVTAWLADPRPWLALKGRTPEEASALIGRWLAEPRRVAPTEALIQAMASLGPRGPELVPLCNALVGWVDRQDLGQPSLRVLRALLADGAAHLDTPTLASLWTEWQRLATRYDLHTEATVLGEVALELKRRGVVRVPILGWLALPGDKRSLPGLHALVERLCDGPGGDAAAAELYRGLVGRGEASLAEELVRAWVRLLIQVNPPTTEDMVAAVRGGPHVQAWARTAAELTEGDALRSFVGAVSGGSPEGWSAAADAMVRGRPEHLALVQLADLLPEGAGPLEQVSRPLLRPALEASHLPNDDLAGVALAFAQVPGTWPLWQLATICSASPGVLDDATIDATVVSFCADMPRDGDDRHLAELAVTRLAEARDWLPLDHARWLVRFLMAPAPDQEDTHVRMAAAMMHAMTGREDGPGWVATITNVLLDLPPDHPALFLYLHQLLPRAWGPQVPNAFTRALRTDVRNPGVRELLEKALRPGRL